MKVTHLITATAISASMVAAAAAADSSSKSSMKSDSSMKSGPLSNIQRTSQESLDRQATAKDLIGSSVYDQAGEKIGDIADISLKHSLSSELVSGIMSKNAEGGSWSGLSDTQRAQSSSKKDSMRDSVKSLGSAARGDLIVFLSVGGLFGIGDDLVSIPASSLTYDAAQDRFTLAASKEEVVQIAQADTEDDYAAGYSSGDEGDFSASQQWNDDAYSVRQALLDDSQLGTEAAMITVTSEGDKLVLRGTVSSDDHKDRAEEVAENATELDIDNSIEVQD